MPAAASARRGPKGRLLATEEFQLAIEAAPVGMILVDGGGRIVLVNAQVETLFGYGRQEIVGQPIDMLVPQRLRGRPPGFRAAFLGDPKSPPGVGRDLFGLRKDGSEVPVQIGLNPLDTPEGQFVLGSVVD